MRQTALKTAALAAVPDASSHAQSYNMTRDWFSNHIPAWDSILGPGRVLEIGSYEGLSTSYIIEQLRG